MGRENYYCIIMAGGVGSRFWPVSRNSKPKQFLDFFGTGVSFLQQTYNRFAKIIPPENIMIVTSGQYKELVEEQLPQMLPENILLEPHRRNTAPCIAYATYKLQKKNPDATVVVAPSDHLIINEDVFLATIEAALGQAAGHDELITLGIKPTRPETGYGYIQVNTARTKEVGGSKVYSVKTFTEKPDAELAKVFMSSGEFLWNSGIFVWNVKTIAQELEKYLPDIANQFKDIIPHYYTPQEEEFIKGIYEGCNGISIDYGVMEKTSCSWVFETSFGWSDVGTWEALYLLGEKDDNGNLLSVGDSMIDKVEGSIVVSSEEDKLVVVKGLKDYMVINTDDVLLVCPRDSVRFKNVITDLTVNEFDKYQ
ncbi:MAG: mannose-1-phosphate guanylyltransferase [Bacteroidales bacterium]|nr:mannose-1-phosphate guanylyltransferase [Bacteroidales bacterium]MBO7269342.1 mannose-1-phosphate guanylyltransferase [Bacteroidales bacterium]